MEPTIDNLLKYITVLLILPVTWAWLQPERSSPWLFSACQALFLAICLLRVVYRYRTNKGPGKRRVARARPEEE